MGATKQTVACKVGLESTKGQAACRRVVNQSGAKNETGADKEAVATGNLKTESNELGGGGGGGGGGGAFLDEDGAVGATRLEHEITALNCTTSSAPPRSENLRSALGRHIYCIVSTAVLSYGALEGVSRWFDSTSAPVVATRIVHCTSMLAFEAFAYLSMDRRVVHMLKLRPRVLYFVFAIVLRLPACLSALPARPFVHARARGQLCMRACVVLMQ